MQVVQENRGDWHDIDAIGVRIAPNAKYFLTDIEYAHPAVTADLLALYIIDADASEPPAANPIPHQLTNIYPVDIVSGATPTQVQLRLTESLGGFEDSGGNLYSAGSTFITFQVSIVDANGNYLLWEGLRGSDTGDGSVVLTLTNDLCFKSGLSYPSTLGAGGGSFNLTTVTPSMVSARVEFDNIDSVTEINVKEYTKYDGVTDDATIVQSLITTLEAAGGGVLFFPEGTCSFATTLQITSGNIILRGAGPGSILEYTGAGNAILISTDPFTDTGVVDPDDIVYHTRVANLKINTSTGITGLALRNVLFGVFDDINITGFSSYAIHMKGGFFNDFNNVRIKTCGHGYLLAPTDGGPPYRSNANTIKGGEIFLASGANPTGIHISDGNGNQVINTTIEGLTKTGIIIDGDYNFINQPWIELLVAGSATTDLQIESGSEYNTFIRNHVNVTPYWKDSSLIVVDNAKNSTNNIVHEATDAEHRHNNLAGTAGIAYTNLATHSSFEDGHNVTVVGTAMAGQFSHETSDGHMDNKSLKIIFPTGEHGFAATKVRMDNTVIAPMSAGDTVYVSLSMKASSAIQLTGRYVFGAETLGSKFFEVDTTWRRFFFHSTALVADGSSGYFHLNVPADHAPAGDISVWVDDIQVIKNASFNEYSRHYPYIPTIGASRAGDVGESYSMFPNYLGRTIHTPTVTQTLSAANPIVVDAGVVKVAGSGGAVTLTSTPTIANGSEGEIIVIQGTDSTNTLTVQSESMLASTNLILNTAKRTLGAGDRLVLRFDGTNWREEPGIPFYENIVTVGGKHGYTKLSEAIADISDASDTNRYCVFVYGKVTEDAKISGKDYVDVIGFDAIVSSSLTTDDAVEFNGVTDSEWKDIKVIKTGAGDAAHGVLTLVGSANATLTFRNCEFDNQSTGANIQDGVLISSPCTEVSFYDCVAKPADTTATTHGWDFNYSGTIVPGNVSLYNCTGYGNNQGGHAFRFTGIHAPLLHDCVACPGLGNNSCGFYIEGASSPVITGCTSRPQTTQNYWSYNTANNGRFMPVASHPYQVIGFMVFVSNATGGATLDVGTSIAGSELVSAMDIGTTGGKFVSFTRVELAADAYLYATPTAGSNDDFRIHTVIAYNYDDNRPLLMGTPGYVRVSNSAFIANGASDACRIVNASITSANYIISNCHFETYDVSNQYSITGQSATSTTKIKNCTFVGPKSNVAINRYEIAAGTAAYTADGEEGIIACSTDGTQALAVTLPEASDVIGQMLVFVFDTDGGQDVTINRAGADTIDDTGDTGNTSATMADVGDILGVLSVANNIWLVLNNIGVTLA